VSAQHIDNLPLFPAEPPDRFKNWQVSLPGSVVFKTLPSTYPNASIRGDAPSERVNQSSLADAGFSRDEYDLAFSCKHLVKPASHPRQCSVALDHCLRYPAQCRIRNGVIAHDFLTPGHRLLDLADRTDEAIASTMRCFNKAWKLLIITQSLSELMNGDFEDSFTDKGPGPDGVEKLLFCDELAWTLEQVVEHGEGFGSQLYCLRAFPQTLVIQVQGKGIENYPFCVPHGDTEHHCSFMKSL
jgi:hypothetical protein